MQPFFPACGNPLPPAPSALQIKPRSNFGLGILLPSLPRRTASQVEGTAWGWERHERIKPCLSGLGRHTQAGSVSACGALQQVCHDFISLVCPGRVRVDGPNLSLAGWQLSCTQNQATVQASHQGGTSRCVE